MAPGSVLHVEPFVYSLDRLLARGVHQTNRLIESVELDLLAVHSYPLDVTTAPRVLVMKSRAAPGFEAGNEALDASRHEPASIWDP